MDTRDWEQCYRDGETPWDKREGAPPLVEWLSRNEEVMAGDILVPGCGLGHDVRVLACRVRGTVTGCDVSPTAVEKARSIPRAGGEEYVVEDLFAPPRAWEGRFSWVWEHTCFCAINPGRRRDYADSMWTVLRPGGTLLGAFYLDPYDEEHQPGDDPPHGCSEEELRDLFERSGRFRWRNSYVPGAAYPGREGRELVVELRKEG